MAGQAGHSRYLKPHNGVRVCVPTRRDSGLRKMSSIHQPSVSSAPWGRNATPARRTASARDQRYARQSGDKKPRPQRWFCLQECRWCPKPDSPAADSIAPRIEPQRIALSFTQPENVADQQARATGEQSHLQAFQILVTHASAERQRGRDEQHENRQPVNPSFGWAPT